MSIYCTLKKIRKQYKNSKLKIIDPTWNDDFELLDGFYTMSGIQHYIEYITKNHEASITIPPIHVCINRINNKLLFKIKMDIS